MRQISAFAAAYLAATVLLVVAVYVPLIRHAGDLPNNLVLEALHSWLVLFLAPYLILDAAVSGLRRGIGTLGRRLA